MKYSFILHFGWFKYPIWTIFLFTIHIIIVWPLSSLAMIWCTWHKTASIITLTSYLVDGIFNWHHPSHIYIPKPFWIRTENFSLALFLIENGVCVCVCVSVMKRKYYSILLWILFVYSFDCWFIRRLRFRF